MNKQSGSAIFIILIAVALFAAIAYVFSQGSRSSIGWVKDEENKAMQTDSASYQLAISSAVKRLKLRGCKDAEISYETPKGNNENPMAPPNGRCHIFRIAGGGVQYRGDDSAKCSTAELQGLNIGENCKGVIYAGIGQGRRIYMMATNQGMTPWNDGSSTGPATSTFDGYGDANTDTLVSFASGGPYQAAQLCRALGADWFLPSRWELNDVADNRYTGELDGTFDTWDFYWTSTEHDASEATAYRVMGKDPENRPKTQPNVVRCVRTD